MRFPRGSEWRKWDLHVHAPGTTLTDGYSKLAGELDWVQFCEIIHDSDVACIGIADYFSLDSFFAFKKQYAALYPGESNKVFFPNLELRLPEVLNDDGQSVNIHLIFRPDLSESDAHKLMMALSTETTAGKSKKSVVCAELQSADEFQSATVSRKSIMTALEHTFGSGSPLENQVLIVTSAKGDGIRPGGKGSKKRKNQLVDEIDKQSHAFFAGPNSRDHFLDVDRLEADEKIIPKPVFEGSDAHSFEDLKSRLGKGDAGSGVKHFVTWIKADLTYEGLLQTLIEPAQRVALQLAEPDQKRPYQYISKIRFSDTNDFPAEVVFNRNLNSIIGSRSSGKSALLAFIAHAVDPGETIQQQIDASKMERKFAGPAAGKTWADVSATVREIEWGAPDAANGKVIYVPQNSLYSISEHPNKVTEKIAPSLFRNHPDLKVIQDQTVANLVSANDDIRAAIVAWFDASDEMDRLTGDLRDLGDKKAVEAARDTYKSKIDEIKKASQLTDEEITKYQEISVDLQSKRSRLDDIVEELTQLSQYVAAGVDSANPQAIPGAVQVTVAIRPAGGQLPDAIAERVEEKRGAAEAELLEAVERELNVSFTSTLAEQRTLRSDVDIIKEQNATLIAKHEANSELEQVALDFDKQVKALKAIEKKQAARIAKEKVRTAEVTKIVEAIAQRAVALTELQKVFSSKQRVLDGLTFGMESAVDPDVVSNLSVAFNRSKISAYVSKKGDDIDFLKAQAEPAAFLTAIRSGDQELNKGFTSLATAQSLMTVVPEVRFTAELDADRIGGFGRSSMTPGKQALFALTLILNESQEPWPLLIDQPEDDLDSRSIYGTIVPYLLERKRERQIIMVSHDANLVVGADSESVIVANRHGADRPNKGGRTFEYLTGSLEHSQEHNAKSATVLGRHGIREHACEILDGGEEAFQKRKEKYKI
ncbi:TrlF family AAA-like ATPase [Glaciibacter psychrotolerans]|uniref:ABC-type cobalamin/Fe3+-siderophores transport system ATPase subunit n=1 Tax=Glaciibacter psychrotolerans TaxID=670054 RepID=A0A7Z0J4E0_9MICO|nr:hypothetical protein [Leifsonia psychrotolerans]NYJ18292.1 ABC-type cobalamin/Fe3+-siderophores transport system ATPase subunit [Leifsonia psychrotolerans]